MRSPVNSWCASLGILGLSAWVGTAAVVINEIHYAPDVKQERVEFVELINTGPEAVTLTGWYLADAVDYRFPAGTTLPAGGYLVVAQDPVALKAKFGVVGALGPWVGRLSSEGERISVRDTTDALVHTVRYQLGFPWPTVGEAPGNSIELLNPGLDADLGGNWRASATGGGGIQEPRPLLGDREVWRYFKGRSEPSATVGAWRSVGFDDSTWDEGELPVGYDPEVLGPAITGGTPLADMRGKYSTIYLRRKLTLTDVEGINVLQIEALYDDGYKFWVNGRLLAAVNLPVGESPFTEVTGIVVENNGFNSLEVSVPAGTFVEGENQIAVQVANVNLSASSDCFFDCRLTGRFALTDVGPTPGLPNRVLTNDVPPSVRQVEHRPVAPRSGETVTVTAKVTDPEGVAAVTLEYQLVRPGAYLRFNTPAYRTNWVAIPMTDDGEGADTVANDLIYSARIPSEVQGHRNLVRYRIRARDSGGAQVRVPYADDAGRNFAYFVYDGVPEWRGAVRPGVVGTAGEVFTVSTNEMNRLPVYHLLATRQDVEDCTWRDRSRGDQYFWTGTLVYDGQVYDHVRFRPRGGVWRYAMGKNMWKFDFNRGRDFQARDNWGRKLDTAWTKVNLGACIQQGDFLHRGEQGMFESVGFRLFELAGVPSSQTAFVQFRIVDDVAEAPAGDQYGGDFWGLYLAVEQPDGRFLQEHGLPDGNFYKMEGGFGDANNLGPDGPVDSSDLADFLNTYNTTEPTESWWRTNLNLPRYFGYQAVVQAIHHYDIADGKNYYYYRDPVAGQWTVVPWDLDLTWADNMYRGGQTGGDEPFKSRVVSNFSGQALYPAISTEFRNRVRELRDLLLNPDEAYRLLDEYAQLVRGTADRSLIEADRAQWDFNPVMSDRSIILQGKADPGRYYQSAVGTRDHAGMVLKLKQYLGYRTTNAAFSLDTISRDDRRPARPQITYEGPPGYPLNRLRFRPSGYVGGAGLRGVQWRIGEVTRPDHAAYDPTRPLPYEVEARWESGELPGGDGVSFTFGTTGLRVGRLYRARVRYLDVEGRASNWSAPVEFTLGEPDTAAARFADLEISELMYNPTPEGFEFIEVANRNPGQSLALDGLRFTSGIQFEFAAGAVLPPAGFGVVLRSTNIAGFRSQYAWGAEIAVLGMYSGSLSNEGETVTLKAAIGSTNEISFTYGVTVPWPIQANGGGRSLVPARGGTTDLGLAPYWRASALPGGSPGRADVPPVLRLDSVQALPDGLEITYQLPVGLVVAVEVSADFKVWRNLGDAPPGGRATVPYEATGESMYVRLRQSGP